LVDGLRRFIVQQERQFFSGGIQRDSRAAQYVRMSTDLQKYSTENQAAAMATDAAQHNLTIVRQYADYGRSGLGMDDREALRQLISDVQTGRADFDVILV
jgi:DNA invertase Pin-like site-specific DNA recombinase